MIINHNINAINTYNNMNKSIKASSLNTKKLSSGYRINTASDDAAGLAISEKMRSQIRGLNQASENVEQGISLVQTAEGALNEDHNILQRIRELAVQSANDTNSDEDREAIQNEVNELLCEINRISETTEFNNIKLLNSTTIDVGSTYEVLNGGSIGEITSDMYMSDSTASINDRGKINIININEYNANYLVYDKVEIYYKNTTSDKKATYYVNYFLNDEIVYTDDIDIYGNGEGVLNITYNNNDTGLQFILTGNQKATGNPFLANDVLHAVIDLKAQLGTKVIDGTKIEKVEIDESLMPESTYEFVKKSNISWDDANADALLKGGHLVTITSEEENNKVKQLVTDAIGNPKGAWTGGYRNDAEDMEWFWVTGEEFEYTNWSKGEPNNYENTTECKLITWTNGKWNDDSIKTSDAKGYVIEYDKYGTKYQNEYAKRSYISLSKEQRLKNGAKISIIEHENGLYIHNGANAYQELKLELKDMSCKSLGLTSINKDEEGYVSDYNITSGEDNECLEKGLSVLTRKDSNLAIEKVDDAIKRVSEQRSRLGAYQNRLESNYNNLTQTSENLTSAESTIRDADMAKEMMELTKNQILQQASQAMLTQAMQRPQQVLQLLQ